MLLVTFAKNLSQTYGRLFLKNWGKQADMPSSSKWVVQSTNPPVILFSARGGGKPIRTSLSITKGAVRATNLSELKW